MSGGTSEIDCESLWLETAKGSCSFSSSSLPREKLMGDAVKVSPSALHQREWRNVSMIALATCGRFSRTSLKTILIFVYREDNWGSSSPTSPETQKVRMWASGKVLTKFLPLLIRLEPVKALCIRVEKNNRKLFRSLSSHRLEMKKVSIKPSRFELLLLYFSFTFLAGGLGPDGTIGGGSSLLCDVGDHRC